MPLFAGPLALLLTVGQAAGLETLFFQVHPPPAGAEALVRSRGQTRAVVLVHGVRIHPLVGAEALRASLHGWQKPGSSLARTLGTESDVFSFAYSQNLDLEDPALGAALDLAVRRLRAGGYQEIVLL